MQKTYLIHHGIKGQKWGIRRFQNEDGTLTPEGEKRYEADSKAREEVFNNTEAYRNSQTKGKTIAKKFLMSEGTRTTYDMLRANGTSRGQAIIKTLFDLNYTDAVSSAIYTTSSAVAAKIGDGVEGYMTDGDQVGLGKAIGSYAGSIAGSVTGHLVGGKMQKNAYKNNKLTSLRQRSLVKKVSEKYYK